jgi:DNA-binding transcriptional ArsR family regulator
MTNYKLFPQQLSVFFKALGNEKRQEIILNVFADYGEHNIGEVAKRAKIAQSTASEHLSLLKRAGILVSRKLEKEVFYKLNRKDIIATLDEIKSILSCCMTK